MANQILNTATTHVKDHSTKYIWLGGIYVVLFIISGLFTLFTDWVFPAWMFGALSGLLLILAVIIGLIFAVGKAIDNHHEIKAKNVGVKKKDHEHPDAWPFLLIFALIAIPVLWYIGILSYVPWWLFALLIISGVLYVIYKDFHQTWIKYALYALGILIFVGVVGKIYHGITHPFESLTSSNHSLFGGGKDDNSGSFLDNFKKTFSYKPQYSTKEQEIVNTQQTVSHEAAKKQAEDAKTESMDKGDVYKVEYDANIRPLLYVNGINATSDDGEIFADKDCTTSFVSRPAGEGGTFYFKAKHALKLEVVYSKI